MKTPEQFVEELWAENEVLYRASELQIKAFYDSNPPKEKLIQNFTRRMVNERMNLTEIMKAIEISDVDTDPKELMSLCKQALDEANHFRMVRDVVEYLNEGPIDLKKHVDWEMEKNQAIRGAKLLAKYECETDELAMALYQLIAEGRAARNWAMMAKCVTDPFIAGTYGKIARDEKFHSKMGRRKLLQICDTPEKQARVVELAQQMRMDLFEVNCKGTLELEESRRMMEEAYGKTTRLEVNLDTSYQV